VSPQKYAGLSKLRDGQFEALSAAMAGHCRMLEVGTLYGVTAAMLAEAHPDARVLSVDIFEELTPACWLQNRRPNQSLFVGTLLRLHVMAPECRFDLIFVDADHRYEACRQDLNLAARMLAPGGRLFAHDYGFREGVTKAVDEFCAETGRKIVARTDTLVELGP